LSLKHKYKIILLGKGSVGKTSIRKKYMGESFNEEYIETIGAEFSSKNIEINNNNIKYQIWDLAGQPEYKNVQASFYAGCNALILVFDLTQPNSLVKLNDWISEAQKQSKNSDQIWVLIGNKCDLERKIEFKEINKFAQDFSIKIKSQIHYMETSAKTGENINDLFIELGDMLLGNERVEFISKKYEPNTQASKESDYSKIENINKNELTQISKKIDIFENRLNKMEVEMKKVKEIILKLVSRNEN